MRIKKKNYKTANIAINFSKSYKSLALRGIKYLYAFQSSAMRRNAWTVRGGDFNQKTHSRSFNCFNARKRIYACYWDYLEFEGMHLAFPTISLALPICLNRVGDSTIKVFMLSEICKLTFNNPNFKYLFEHIRGFR